MTNEEFAGRWQEPEGTPVGRIEWIPPSKTGLQTHVAIVDGKKIGVVRAYPNVPGNFVVEMTGWMWAQPAKESTAAKIGIKEIPMKSFKSLRIAKAAAEFALSQHPGHYSEDKSS